jgi:hypothetical protein
MIDGKSCHSTEARQRFWREIGRQTFNANWAWGMDVPAAVGALKHRESPLRASSPEMSIQVRDQREWR